MPRMPTITLLLLLLLTMWSTQSHARAVKRPATEPSILLETEQPATESPIAGEEDTTYSGGLEMNTVTIPVDADAIMITDDAIQMFTSLPDLASTEEPLPDSVVQQLEQERAERDGQRTTKSPSTTEEPISPEETTTTATTTNDTTRATTTQATTTQATTTQAATTTTDAAIAGTTIQPEPVNKQAVVGQKGAVPDKSSHTLLNPKSAVASIAEESQDMNLESISSIGDVAGYITTEQTARIAEEPESYGHEQTTNVPLIDSNTSGSFSLNAMASGTDSTLMELSTFMESMSNLVESTTEMDAVRFMTTQLPEANYEPAAEFITEANNSTTTERSVMRLLSRLSLNTITQKPGVKPEAESITTEDTIIQTTFSTTRDEVGSTTEADTKPITIAPPKQQSLLEAMVMLETDDHTTETAVASTVAPASTTDSPMISSSSTSTTTTEPPPIPTTELRLMVTREPRIERIFNPDGVEVLYGYSNVVRTNRS